MNRFRGPFTINRDAKKIAKSILSPIDALEAKRLMPVLREAIEGSTYSVFTQETRDRLAKISALAERIAHNRTDYYYISPKPGRTFLPVVITEDGAETEGAVFILEVFKLEKKGAHRPDYLERPFTSALAAVKDLVFKYNSSMHFAERFNDAYSFRLTDRFGKELDSAIKISGDSAALPMAMALFSLIFKRELNLEIACTGDLNLNEVLPVNGVRLKYEAVACEFDEVARFVYKGSISEVTKIAGVEPEPCNKLEDALKLYYKDYRQLLAEVQPPGALSYELRRITDVRGEEGNSLQKVEGLELVFKMEEGERFKADYLQKLSHINVNETVKNGAKILIFNNAKASWHIGFLTAHFKGKFDYLAVYDPKETKGLGNNCAFIVHKGKDAFNLGDLISYTSREVIPLQSAE